MPPSVSRRSFFLCAVSERGWSFLIMVIYAEKRDAAYLIS